MSALMNALVQAVMSIMDNIAAKTATFNGAAFDTLDYDGIAQVELFVGAVTGTTPTLDGKLQESDTSGGTYTDIAGATFTQVTASNATQAIAVDVRSCKRFIRFVGTIAGTTPSFTMGVLFNGIKKYR